MSNELDNLFLSIDEGTANGTRYNVRRPTLRDLPECPALSGHHVDWFKACCRERGFSAEYVKNYDYFRVTRE